ncbi:hypothetical protein EJG51_017220 [Undibacterium piscinae]|uniref:Uncharacterized protein n=1 Tax=Undibacterium piscinae TaxID=2495591 RepID=A0A6M4A922_9BURK|nr:hypothetical protein EJG51_017220 [Undibacterium piscinae]
MQVRKSLLLIASATSLLGSSQLVSAAENSEVATFGYLGSGLSNPAGLWPVRPSFAT